MRLRRLMAGGFAALVCAGGVALSQEWSFGEADQIAEADKAVAELNVLLKRAATRRAAGDSEGGIFASCVEQRFQTLQQAVTIAKSISAGRALWPKSPAFAVRSVSRLRELVVYAKILAENAEKCADARQVAAALDDLSLLNRAPPLALERPPLASPY